MNTVIGPVRHPSAVLKNPKFVVFDFDGVLADTVQTWFSVVVEELNRFGVEADLDTVISKYRGSLLADSIADFERDFDIVLPSSWEAAVVQRAVAEVQQKFAPIPDAIETARAIAATGIPIAVASGSYRSAVSAGISELGLADVVGSQILSSHDDGHHKPDPRIYLRAARMLGFEPHQGIAVEDSPTGVESANKAGLFVIGFANHGERHQLMEAGAEITVPDMTRLRDLFRC